MGLIVAFNLSVLPNFFSKNNDEERFLKLLDKEFAKSIEDNPIYASYLVICASIRSGLIIQLKK